MELNKIVLITAMYLGRDDVVSFLENENQTAETGTLELINNLTRCANLVINELSLSYIPMYKDKVVNTTNNRVYYSELDETVTEIINVCDEYGADIDFSVKPEYIEVNHGRVTVRYKYIPSNYGLDDEIGYTEAQAPARILAYGTASEYCLAEHGFEESLMWRNRFCEALSNLISPKNKKIKERRFFL